MPVTPPDRTARSATRREPHPGLTHCTKSGCSALAIRRMPSRHCTRRPPGELVHARRVDRHAVDRLRRRLEPGLSARQTGQVRAPLLNADGLAPAPVDGHRRDRRRGEQARHHHQDVVGVQRVIDARGVHVDGDGRPVQHHVQVDGGPPAVVAVGHRQSGDGGGQLEALRRPAGRALRGDLADAVRAQERPNAVVVAQRAFLVEDAMPLRLVDRRGGAVQEGTGASVMLHEVGQPPAVGRQVLRPVVGLGDGEVEHVLGVLGQSSHVA